ncbi:epimerase [Microcella alkaliphila]|jgi:NAD dependent epimerase/dehydratase family enzyme|nr:DUF1731 domain-containing protein [Microcella alkaliphila]
MTPRVVIAGASGFIGDAVARDYADRGWQIVTIGRRGPVAWSDETAVAEAVDGADTLINLAGRSVNCRYTAKNRAEILSSRVDTTRQLNAAVRNATHAPRLWLNASTATIYRHATDRPQTESGGEIGTRFSEQVAAAWESALFDGDLPGTRRVALRLSIVFGAGGGALPPITRLARLGLGGPQHDGPWLSTPARRAARTDLPPGAPGGHQMVSWIHIDDVIAALRFLDARDDIAGAVNITAPHPVDNRTFMRQVRHRLGRPIGLPSYRFMLEPAMAVLRTEPELVLKSRWVLPERLEAAGFAFTHPDLDEALASILNRP